MARNMLKVFFLSPEMVPFAKTGGLADVAGSLPAALHKLGIDVRVGLPYYRVIKEQSLDTRIITEALPVLIGGDKLTGRVLETKTQGGVPVYFFEREDLFDRPNLYGTPEGDYYDNLERFAFFSQAALSLAGKAAFHFDIVHCHDWQTGLIPAYLKTVYGSDPFFSGAASVFTIHNIGYQGIFPAEEFALLGLPADAFHPRGLEYWGKLSLLKAGIVYADAVTTVSPRYSREIQTPEFGMGMEGVLKDRSALLQGILNGVDYDVWDPARDANIPSTYSPGQMHGKSVCKKSLIKEMGLDPLLESRPLLGIISRLSTQKGLDLLVQVLDDLLGLDVGLVVLGAGDESIQRVIQKAARRHPGRLGLRIGFDESLAHRIMAGADLFLIPSRYEPCGLTQMYALKYGTVPVVRATGGLDDAIVSFDAESGQGNGFKFAPYEPSALLQAVGRAVAFFDDSETWRRIVANGMMADFSWDRSAQNYVRLYQSLVRSRSA